MNRRERRRAEAVSRAAPQSVQNSDVARQYQDAVQFLKAGRLDESEIAHRRVLALSPKHPPSLHHLGLIAFQRRNLESAVEFVRQSVAAKPDYHEAWLNLAIILGELSRSKEAIEACRECVALQPKNANAHAVLGNLLRVANNDAEAMTAYLNALDLKPDQPIVLARLGELRLKSSDIESAKVYCKRALALDPELKEAKNLDLRLSAMLGLAGTRIADIEAQAGSAAERARKFDHLATHLRENRRFEEAADLCRRAIVADPGVADYHFNLALTYEGLGYRHDALASYKAGLAIDPDRAEGYACVGMLLSGMNMHTGAVQALEHAIKLNPKLAYAYYNLAIIHKLRENYDEARAAFQKCLECAPDEIVNRFEYVNLRRLICDWNGVDDEERACLEIFRAKDACVAPFQLIALRASPADQLKAAQSYTRTFDVPPPSRFSSHRSRLGAGQRIRIGFLSCDFFEHATAMLFAEVLERLDRDRFEIFGYCHSPEDNSATRQRLLRAFEHLKKIGTMRNRDVAQSIHDDAIDILVDLKGYTRDARSEIFAYRPAPIQVNYLGYPGTMGASFIDYIIADAMVAPMDAQEFYTERIVHLPHSYQPNDCQRQISDAPMSRADFGLPEDAFVFCSFNNSYKLNATMFDVWMPLLQQVPGSVLWLLVPNTTCAENLRREAEARGVDPARLVFAKRMPIAEHLARHRFADLFLDALPCNAHTTTTDALWGGLPVLTCLGDTFAGRVAASLLSAIELPELITTNLADYSRLAMELAQDKPKLEAIRNKLAIKKQSAPLFDPERYTRNLETSFETMLEIKRAGDAPRPFAVSEDKAMQIASSPIKIPAE
ncbi:MAG: tetratricopeptide repeat protein [Proteobacteria bacterium]|nr:tetratricopeptide repeat protein [Pseudomonadota bacterium]